MRAMTVPTVDWFPRCEDVGALILIFVLCAFVYNKIQIRNMQLPLPPGPPAHWLFGNVMPTSYAHRKFAEWTECYGPVFSLRQGSNILIVIGRQDAACEIMEKQGSLVADRPRSIAAGEILSGGMRVLTVGAGDRLRKLRRALHASLSINISKNYEPVQMANAKNVILDILEDAENHIMHAKRYAASLSLSMTYGKTTSVSYADPEVIRVNKCAEVVGRTMLPGAWLIDTYPILRYIPGYLSQLRKWHTEELLLFREQLSVVKENIAAERAPASFAKYLLEHQKTFELGDDELAYLAGSMFGAAADTTASAISTIVMAAAAFPDAQAKVQEELDNIIGRDRAPMIKDENILPQTRAFILETNRWRPVNVGGVAHRTTKDIIWRNYRIPAGANIVGNHWAIGRDPAVFPEPERFNPQRWLRDDGTIRQDLKSCTFGFGRRICPGQHVAERSVFINTALLLWSFRISQMLSSPIDTLAFTDSMNSHPLPFTVDFETRIKTPADLREIMDGYGNL